MTLETSTTSKATLAISGVCYSGNMKASVANVLQVWYRYKADDGDYGEWVSVAATPNNNKYSATVVLNNLDYQTTYTFEARVQDTLYAAYGNYVTSPERVASTLPVFDWSKTDFNFNVNARIQKDINFESTGGRIRALKPDGLVYDVFAPSNSGGNTVLGYDNYANETYNTNIYGKSVNILCKDKVTIDGFTFGKNQILWSGALYMTDAQSIDLSDTPVSAQPHGIVLVWSAYVDGAAQNYHWHQFFIPKDAITRHNNAGRAFFMVSTPTFGAIANKYCYLNNTKITGHANNKATGTSNGITYNNAHFVLRYVIGV